MAARSYGNPVYDHPGIISAIFATIIVVGFIFAVYTGGTSGHAGGGAHPAPAQSAAHH